MDRAITVLTALISAVAASTALGLLPLNAFLGAYSGYAAFVAVRQVTHRRSEKGRKKFSYELEWRPVDVNAGEK